MSGPPSRPGEAAGRPSSALEELRFPNSLGLLYSAFTYPAGFEVNSGQYKLMGLVPYAGGVALNCVNDGRIARERIFDRIWAQPAAGDAGSSIGAATWACHQVLGNDRTAEPTDEVSGALLGPAYTSEQVTSFLDLDHQPYERICDDGQRARRVAEIIDDGGVVGVFQGLAEFGPGALGNRSILADPRSATVQRSLNLLIKQRESFRPFAPAVLVEQASSRFGLCHEFPTCTSPHP